MACEAFHGGAPERGAGFLRAESYGAVRCVFWFLGFMRCVRYKSVKAAPHRIAPYGKAAP